MRIRNKKGVLTPTIALIVIGGMLAPAVITTALNGRMKNNGKIIWCKMQNKGNAYCDMKYGR